MINGFKHTHVEPAAAITGAAPGLFAAAVAAAILAICALVVAPVAGASAARSDRPAGDGGRYAAAQDTPCPAAKDGDPAFYWDFGEGFATIFPGGSITYRLAPGNFAFVSSTCPGTDTLCVDIVDTEGWTIYADPPLHSCFVLEPSYVWWQDITITAPCDAAPCDYDTLFAVVSYCGPDGICRPECGDCEDPNWYEGQPYYYRDTLVIHVTEAPPALHILQDTLSYVAMFQEAAYVPFYVCNGDPCAPPGDYAYCITNGGLIGGPFEQCDSALGIPGGECAKVYAVVDASVAEVCDFDTLTIVAWSLAEPVVYDTCVQLIHAIPIMPVPVFSWPVALVLVLALVLATVVFLRRRASPVSS